MLTKVVMRKIADLKPHPRQAELFGDASPAELEALAADIEANGLRQPPVVLPDGTIVCGHQRIRAFQRLGRTEVPVIVDGDLDQAGAVAVEKRLIEDNNHRRHFDELTIARCCKRLMELEKNGGRGQLAAHQEAELRDRIGERFNVSGRTVSRYVRVLETPIEVQQAVSAGGLSIGAAEKVAGLAKPLQAQIAAAIRNGGDPAAVIQPYIRKPSGPRKHAGKAVARFLRDLESGLTDLEGRAEKITEWTEEDAEVLGRAGVLIEVLRAQVKFSTGTASDSLSDGEDREVPVAGN